MTAGNGGEVYETACGDADEKDRFMRAIALQLALADSALALGAADDPAAAERVGRTGLDNIRLSVRANIAAARDLDEAARYTSALAVALTSAATRVTRGVLLHLDPASQLAALEWMRTELSIAAETIRATAAPHDTSQEPRT